jgi:hypothetical protein
MKHIGRWLLVLVTALVLTSTHVARGQTTLPPPRPPSPLKEIGRFIIVNGTPDTSRNIMLLDTVTGASWILCHDKDNGDGWCRLFRSDAPSAGR